MKDAVNVARARFEDSDHIDVVDEFVNQDGDRIFKLRCSHHDDPISLTADGLNAHSTVMADIELSSYSVADHYFVEVQG